MEHDWALQLASQMLIVAAWVAAPLLIANLGVGLVISVIQVVTQVQEATLTFVPKVVISIVVMLLLGGWMLGSVEHFTQEAFLRAATFAK